MKNINFKDRRVVSSLIIFSVLLVASIGATAAYFVMNVRGNDNAKDITVSTANLELTYVDGPEIRMESVYPGEYIDKTFTVTNTGSVEVSYAMGIINYINTFVNDELVVSYTCKSYKNYGKNSQEEYGTCYDLEEKALNDNVIDEGIQIDVGITHEISMRIKFKETGFDQNSNQGKEFSGLLNIEDNGKAFTLVLQLVNTQETPIVNANVEVHSVLRKGVTNEEGYVIVPNLTEGIHNIIAYSEDKELLNGSFEIKASPDEKSVAETTITGKQEDTTLYVKAIVDENKSIASMAEVEASVLSVDLVGGTTSQTFKNFYIIGETLELVTPTKQGYTFKGWTVTGATEAEGVLTFTESNSSITATWEVNSYSIEYVLNGGQMSNAPLSATYGQGITVPIPTKEGYVFMGWTITGMDTVIHTYGSNVTQLNSLSNIKATLFKSLRSTSGTVTFTAVWIEYAGLYLKDNVSSINSLNSISHNSTGNQNYATTDYRYQGASGNVNNWVYFNCKDYTGTLDSGKEVSVHDNTKQCERWRIIGSFQTEANGPYRLKIVHNTRIDGGTGSKDGWYWDQASQKSNWSNSPVQKYLNNETNGTYNLYGSNIQMVGYVASLSSTAKDMLYSTKWYLGDENYERNTASAYGEERSNTTVGGAPATFTAKVGLMYPSDYGYASSGCYNGTLLSVYNNNNCKSTNWLYSTQVNYEWLITPGVTYDFVAFRVYGGEVCSNRTFNNSFSDSRLGIRPTVYLNNTAYFSTGSGTEASPWMLEME